MASPAGIASRGFPAHPLPRAMRAMGRRQRQVMPVRVLVASAAALTVIGLVMVLSASSVWAFSQYGSSFLFFKRQLVYACVGGVLALLAARLDYRLLQRFWGALLVATVLLLLLVLHPSIGKETGGAARWLPLGSLTFQPSELAKLVVVAGTASILAANVRYLHDPVLWLVPLVPVVGAVIALILLQPDLGTAAVIAVTVLLLLFAAGVRLRLLVASALISSLVGIGVIFAEGYRRTRLLSFLHPWSDPHSSGYQVVQSLIALGSGHLFGVGLGASRQKWMYVPNAHTDFIFSILGEELGLVGELVVLLLFAALLYAGVRIALAAPDPFGRLLAAGITGWLGTQALINLGAVTGILPITGVPLPFLSFGGSSLVVSLVGVGVLVSVGRRGGSPQGVGRGRLPRDGRRPGRPRPPKRSD